MKFNFKKVASVIATTAMLGSTIAFATAALSLPASDYAVVYGADTDNVAALNMAAVLTGTGTTVISGDNIKLARPTDSFNLGDNMTAFYSSLDDTKLTKVLAKGVYSNDANNEYDYTQKIDIAGGLQLKQFLDSDFNNNQPIVGFKLDNSNSILNYTLQFTPDKAQGGAALACGTGSAAFCQLETTNINMLGRDYYIVKAEANTNQGVKLTLLDSANTAIVSQGTTSTVGSYSVDVTYIDTSNVILSVNGVSTNKLAEGDVAKIGTDTYVAVKNILFDGLESSTKKVEISVGTGKIVLQDGQEVEMNNKAISNIDGNLNAVLTAYVTNSSTDISAIKLEWKLGDTRYIAPGSDLVLPGFETIKVGMTGFNTPTQETTELAESSSDKFDLKTTITDGPLDMKILYNNDTNILGLGEKDTHKLVTSTLAQFNLSYVAHDYFVSSWKNNKDSEAYAFELLSVTANSGDNSTVLNNLAGGSDITFSKVGDTVDRGSVSFTLVSAGSTSGNKWATVSVNATSGTVYGDRIITKNGMQIKLPTALSGSIAANDGGINLTALPTSWIANITEADKDGNIAAGNSIRVTNTVSSDGIEPSKPTSGITVLETSDGSKQYTGYVVSDIATNFFWDNPSSGANSLKINYPMGQSTADVYIAEAGTTATTTSGVTPVLASAMTAADKAKNLIVVGGSCINTVAAKLITGLETPLCGAAFSAQTGVGAGKYMIKGYDSPYATGKIAILVAGYEAAQTADAVNVVKAKSTLTKSLDEVGPTLAA